MSECKKRQKVFDDKGSIMIEENELSFIRQDEVTKITSIPKSSIQSEVQEGNFPKPIKLSARTIAWVKSEVIEWMENKIAERDLKLGK